MELILFISSISSMNVSTQPHMFVYEGTSLSLCRKGILFINSIKGDIQSLFPSQVLWKKSIGKDPLVLDLPEISGMYNFVLLLKGTSCHLIADLSRPNNIVLDRDGFANNSIIGAGKLWVDYKTKCIQIDIGNHYKFPNEEYLIKVVSLLEKEEFSCRYPVRVPASWKQSILQ